MSIEVSQITKVYGTQKALNQVNFQVKPGEIIGFLGPNGAGKSTMMKIITCFLPQTSGSVKVCGFDVLEQSLEVRRKVGYLTEHNSLYLDMYVREYLAFAAGLSGIKKTAKRVSEMIDTTGLGDEQHKIIGALSKGYRQRVGLAQAMIHDPEVLILDEPTTGLDPNQLVGIRNLIKNLGKAKTVMLSTHIMQEVEAMCSRVIIIHKGNIVADDYVGNILSTSDSRSIIQVEFDKKVSEKHLMAIEGVIKINKKKDTQYELFSRAEIDIRPSVFRFAVDNQLTVLTISRKEESLEEIFRQLTGNNSSR
ncbi:MAG: gliding motility-associated ABC transporter ATP-binding subunit GldA [Flavobacteriales bacterium]